ncbi:PAS domain S-box protein [Segetibacter sp. 3557_3]|uniref:PAS domain-containing sensor histidine kinase n=1 Tax=Segetibacter sp. 3557_3 TaxID=2547429 RepID=UPI0010588FE3|nr:PAS domain-containing protein [Segetibacter sp. 3557_3]TDH27295.1 PAS domain S-box protein [Segetibacter sp. 3557_3]
MSNSLVSQNFDAGKAYKKAFESLPGNSVLVLPDKATFTIVAFTAGMFNLIEVAADTIAGKELFEVLNQQFFSPHLDISAINNALQVAVATRQSSQLELQYYLPQEQPGNEQQHRWKIDLNPISDDFGVPMFLTLSFSQVAGKMLSERAHASRKNFEYFFTQANNPFAILRGKDLVFTFANPVYQHLLNDRELVGKSLSKAIPELEGQPFEQLLKEVYDTGTPWHSPEIAATAHFDSSEELTTRFFNLSYTPYRNEKGIIEGILASGFEVTEEKKLREQEQTYKLHQHALDLFMQAPVGINIFLGPEHVLQLANKASLAIAGMSGDIIGKPLKDVLLVKQFEQYIRRLDEVYTTGKSVSVSEVPLTVLRNGVEIEIFVSVVYQPIIEAEQVTGVLSIINDVTEQVVSRRKAEASDYRFKKVLQQAPDPIFILKGPEFILEEANEQVLRLWRVGVEAFGKRFIEILPEMKDQGFLELLEAVYTTGKTHYGHEVPAFFIRENGAKETGHFNFVYHPYREMDNTISGVLVMATDVSEQVLAREQIQKNERNFRSLVMRAPVGIAIVKGKTHLLEIVNERMLEFWGRSAEQVIGKTIFDALPEIRNLGFEEVLDQVFRTGVQFTATEAAVELMKNGLLSRMYGNIVWEALRENDGTVSGIMIVVTDVSEQVLSRKRIEESEATFHLLADSMPQFVWTSNAQGIFNYFNKAFYKATGLTEEQIQNNGWLNIIHPEDKEENIRRWYYAVETGNDFIFQHRFKHHDGEYKWHLTRAIAQRDLNGDIQLWVGTSTDIHEHKLFQEQLQTRVKERTSELEKKNSELEQYAYVSSHDLQEPLRKIQMFASLIRKEEYADLGSSSKKMFDKIIDTVERMGDSLKALLNFTTLNKHELLTPVDLNQVLKTVINDLELLILQKNARINTDVLPVIKAMPLQMNQLFLNVIHNALKFSKPGTNPEINVNCKILEAHEKELHPDLSVTKEYWKITIADNGIGFSPVYASQIFGMFQRLHNKNEYEGTGIGLALCKKVAINHLGDIYATSEMNIGSSFHIILPVS